MTTTTQMAEMVLAQMTWLANQIEGGEHDALQMALWDAEYEALRAVWDRMLWQDPT